MIMIKYLDKISNINENNIPNLDLVVMSALELFSVNKDFSL
jgi:DNA polymerase III alpha subunit (gram-positive type)